MSDEQHTAPLEDDAPAIDKIGQRRLEFLRKTVAKDATNAEIGHFLELCGKYDLDPFAHECWLAVSTSSNGKRNVLLMTGRNGLRKIAMRQGFVIDGDVVHEKDRFSVTRNADRTRTITHEYAEGDRGPITSAWAQVYDQSGKQRGYFNALMREYRPTNERKLQYSPWGSQESVMILAAAERTALGMATPLSGIVATGELDAGEERQQLAAGNGTGEAAGIALPPAVEVVMRRAEKLGHAGLSDRGAVEMAVGDQPAAFVEQWVKDATLELNAMAEPVDAVVVSE